MPVSEQSVIVSANHLDRMSRLLDAYCANACAYFEDYSAILGSTVAMRKALELMGAYALFHFTKKRILVKSGSEVFRGKYALPAGTQFLYERMKALSQGAHMGDGRDLPGLSRILHYQGYRSRSQEELFAFECEGLFGTHKLFLTLFPEFQGIVRDFCHLAQIDTGTLTGLDRCLGMLCDLETTFPLLQSVETQLRIAFEESADNGWLEWHARILLRNDTNEARDEMLTDDTIMACCRSIAEKVMYTCACRAKASYAAEVRDQRSCALDRFITDYRNCPTPRIYEEQEAKSKDLSRAMTIRSYADANLHWVDRSLSSSLMRFEDLHEGKTVLINWQKMIQCGSELIRSVVLLDQPRAVQRLIERYYERVPSLRYEMEQVMRENEELRGKASDSAAPRDGAQDAISYDLFEALQKRFYGEKQQERTPSWLKERRDRRGGKEKSAKKEEPISAQKHPDTYYRLDHSDRNERLPVPACRREAASDRERERRAWFKGIGGLKTIVLEQKPLLVETEHREVVYLRPTDGTVTLTPDGDDLELCVRLREDEDRRFILVSLQDSRCGLMNAAVFEGDVLLGTTEPVKQAALRLSSIHGEGTDANLQQLRELGYVEERPSQKDVFQTHITEYAPEKLRYYFVDAESGEVIVPQIFVDTDKRVKMRLKLSQERPYIFVPIAIHGGINGVQPHGVFGAAYCQGKYGLKKDLFKAADEFYRGYEEGPDDVACCYELGCMFRYVPELHDEADALEFLGIAAEWGHAGARYEWAKLVLSGQYDEELRMRAAAYMLELLRCGYRFCGAATASAVGRA